MGPKHDGKWEYAGEPDFKWQTWKEHGNDKEGGTEAWSGKSRFEYRDGGNIGDKSEEFPEVGYQENPEKERS